MLALGHRRQHSDAQPAVSGAFRGRRGKNVEIVNIFLLKLNASFTVISNLHPIKMVFRKGSLSKYDSTS